MLKAFKLISGDDIIAQVVSEDYNVFIIKNPIRLVLVPSDGVPTLTMMPWILGSRDSQEIKLNSAHILAMVEPEAELIDAHTRRFGGIITTNTMPPPDFDFGYDDLRRDDQIPF